MFSIAVTIMLFISEEQYYVPLKLCKTAGMLTPENVKLKQNYIWDILEVYCEEVNVTLNKNKVN